MPVYYVNMACPAILQSGKICGRTPGVDYAHTGHCGLHQLNSYPLPSVAPRSIPSDSLTGRRESAMRTVQILSDLAKLQAPKVRMVEKLEKGRYGKMRPTAARKALIEMTRGKGFELIHPEMEKHIMVSGTDVDVWMGYGWLIGKKDGRNVRFPAVKRKCDLKNGNFVFTSETMFHEALEIDTPLPRILGSGTLANFVKAKIEGWLDETEDSDKATGIDYEDVVVYVTDKSTATGSSKDLERWTKSANLNSTAFFKLYYDSVTSASGSDGEVTSLLPLNQRQREAIVKAREADVTVISGPPGCGKSHTLVALAIDKLAAGETVLITTQNEHAQRAILEILDDVPEIPFLVFGNPDYDSLSSQIDRMRNQPPPQWGAEQLAFQEEEVSALKRSIVEALKMEEDVEKAIIHQGLFHLVDDIGIHLRDQTLDILKVEELLSSLTETEGFLGGWKAKQRGKTLRKMIGARKETSWEDITDAIEQVSSHRNMQRSVIRGGLDLQATWRQLELAQERLDLITAEMFSNRLREKSQSSDWEQLSRMKHSPTAASSDFLKVAPLWIGTLADIERVLPNVPGMFDTVILDEASQISQIDAAPALLRARKAVVIGDEKQLDHVSFVSHEAVQRAIESNPVDDEVAEKLNVRDSSIMDVASDHPITWLDEHFRSTPHIIDFSNKHFYNNSLKMMTAHPSNESSDAIDMQYVEGRRINEVNEVEISETIEALEVFRDAKEGSVGVVTPFRKQADAIREAALKAFSLQEIQDMDLRIGTVHGFQGSERDTMIVSLAVDSAAPSALRFIQDPHLFNVMVTRAKNRMHMITSIKREDLPSGLLRSYIDHSDGYTRSVDSGHTKRVWASTLEEMIAVSGCRVLSDYVTGDHVIDLVVGEGRNAIAVETAVHPEGPERHLERRQALEKAGWKVVEAFQSKWNLEEAEIAIKLMETAGYKR